MNPEPHPSAEGIVARTEGVQAAPRSSVAVTGETLLEVQSLSKCYGKQPVLRGMRPGLVALRNLGTLGEARAQVAQSRRRSRRDRG